ncbi:hypothetical protein [Limnoglobus roseus]|uniref:hypothetical protein n=1 Tax=Limnoglobus roseus TaxID=2598579 RepID=UPI0011EB50BE|nr:hypothetical protein [Limnoglobus roseus]
MLTIIVMTEDAKRYSGPVSFYSTNLADQCGFSRSSMERARDRAASAGWLHYTPGTKGRAAMYWVTIPPEEEGKPDGPSDDDSVQMLRQVDAQSEQQPNSIRAQSDVESGQHVTHSLTSSSSSPFPKEDATRSGSLDPVDRTKSAKQKTKKPKADESEAFLTFWAAYPKREAKQDAIRAFHKLNPSPELLAVLLAAIDRQRRSSKWMSDNGKYITHAATWLNGRRWEDDVGPIQPPPTATNPNNATPAALRANGLL